MILCHKCSGDVKACKECQPHDTRTVRIMHLAAFAKLVGLDVEGAYDSVSHVFSFGDADDTLVSVGRMCAVLGIAVPAGLDDIFIGLGS